MLYRRSTFTVPAAPAKSTIDCEQVGQHAMAGPGGICIRCGKPVGPQLVKDEPAPSDAGTVYVELLGGPFDGEIVRGDELGADVTQADGAASWDGQTYVIERDGLRARYGGRSDEYKGMARLEHIPD